MTRLTLLIMLLLSGCCTIEAGEIGVDLDGFAVGGVVLVCRNGRMV